MDVSDMFFDHSPSTTCPIAQVSEERHSSQAHTVKQILPAKHHRIQHSDIIYYNLIYAHTARQEVHLQSWRVSMIHVSFHMKKVSSIMNHNTAVQQYQYQ